MNVTSPTGEPKAALPKGDTRKIIFFDIDNCLCESIDTRVYST